MATFKPVVLAGDAHLKSDGTKNVKIRIYHNDGNQFISTPYFIEPEFLLKSGLISEQYYDADAFNYEITNIIQKCRSCSLKLGSWRLSMMTCMELKEYISASLNKKYEFIDFVSFSKEVSQKAKKAKTADWYENAVISLCWFFKREKIDVRELTVNKLEEYKEQLAIAGASGKPLKPGGINNYLRAIRALLAKARKIYNNEDKDVILIPNDPFKKVSIPKYRRSRKNLSLQDIIRIRDGEFSTSIANMSRDVFMMMFYLMGININDLYKQKDIVGGRFVYERSKTETDDNTYRFPLSIRVEPELKALFDKYSYPKFGFLSHFKRKYCCHENFMRAVNDGLKIISNELCFGSKITTNWARHSWASIARNKAEISKADIDFCLGHVNNDYKMADIYIDIDYSIFDKSNRTVLDLLK